MRSTLLTLLLGLCPLAVTGSATGSVPARATGAAAPPIARAVAAPASQDDSEAKPDKRPEVKDLLTRLGEHVKARGDEDRDAIAVIDELVKEFPESGPKDRQAIVKGVGKCFNVKRKDIEQDVPDNRLYLASAVALGQMGPESAKVLQQWVNHKKHRKDVTLQRKIIIALGNTKVESAVPTLIDLLNHKDYAIVGAGAEALGEYAGATTKVRKKSFESLLKVLMSAWGAKEQDVNDLIAAERWDAIAAPLTTSLQRLSGQDPRQPPDWQRWWNKNKRGDWPSLD